MIRFPAMFATAIGLIVLGGWACASEEEFLPWSEVRIVAPEIKAMGVVVLSAKTDGAKYREVSVEAFGKRYDLDKEQLDKLSGFPLSSLRATHEAGYERLGGHTVYFQLKKVTYDGDRRPAEDRVVVSVSKGRGLAVSAPRPAATEKPEKKPVSVTDKKSGISVIVSEDGRKIVAADAKGKTLWASEAPKGKIVLGLALAGEVVTATLSGADSFADHDLKTGALLQLKL